MDNCPICGQSNTEIIFKKGNLNKDLTNVICRKCALVYIGSMITKEQYAKFHKEEFLAEKNLKKFEDVRERLDARDIELKKTVYLFLKEYIKPKMKVLDVGCGFGSLLAVLKKQADAEVYGVELGNLDIIAARERFGLDLFHGPLEEFAGKQANYQKFDIIVTHHVLEHLSNPLESLEQIKRMLKQDGILYIGVPNLMNIKKRPDILFQIAHPFTYSPYSLRIMLEKAGFGILKFNRNAGYPGGMEMAAKFGAESIKNPELEEGKNYQDAIFYVNKRDQQFAVLRRIRDKLLFFAPKDLRIKFGRGVYKFFKKYNPKIFSINMASARAYIKKYSKEFLLVFLAIIAQSAVFIVTIFWGLDGFMWLSDSSGYLEIARNFLTAKCFCTRPEWGPQAYRTPIYPLFIALFYWLANGVWLVIVIQNIIAAGNILLTYKLGKIIFGPRIGFLGALLLIFESARLELSSQLMSETLFVFFFLLTVYFFIKFVNDNEKLYLILSAISAGVATLTRPALQFFPLGIILFFVIFGIARRNIKKCLLSALLFLAFFAVTISPWLIRNYAHFGKWELSSIGGYNFYVIYGGRFLEYRLKLSGADSIDITTSLHKKFLKDLNLSWTPEVSKQAMEPQYEDYFFKEGRKIISSDVPFFVWVQARRMITFFMESSVSRSYGALLDGLRPHIPSKIFYPFLYFGGRALRISYDLIILAAFIFFFSTFKKKIWSNLFLLGMILYFAILSGSFTDVGRQRQPIEPLFFLFLGNAIILFYDKFKNKVHKRQPE